MKPLTHPDARIFLGSTLGPVFLSLGFACLLFKSSTEMWQLIAVAFAGMLATWIGAKKGFIASLLALAVVVMYQHHSDSTWPLVFAASIVLSWLILLLSQQEAQAWMDNQRSAIDSLEQDNHQLVTHIQLAIEARNEEEKSRQNWKEKHERMALEVARHERKQQMLQQECDEMKDRLVELQSKQQLPVAIQDNLIQQEEEKPEDPQYAQLKEQFEEKSDILNQTRKQLFSVESQLLALQKQMEEQDFEEDAHDVVLTEQLRQVESLQNQLEQEVVCLEEIISKLHQPKKTARVRKAKTKEQVQEDLLDLLHH